MIAAGWERGSARYRVADGNLWRYDGGSNELDQIRSRLGSDGFIKDPTHLASVLVGDKPTLFFAASDEADPENDRLWILPRVAVETDPEPEVATLLDNVANAKKKILHM